jgi:transcriptional regulator EpsA
VSADGNIGPPADATAEWESVWRTPELERLLRFLEAAAAVRRRPQLFLLAQGELQDLLPHDLLLCAVRDPRRGGFRLDLYSGTPVADEAIGALLHPGHGLVRQAMTLWESRGGEPLLLGAKQAAVSGLGAGIEALRLSGVAGHGVLDASGDTASFFAFCRGTAPLTERQRLTLDLLVPHLHRALTQVALHELRLAAAESGAPPPITDREVEILRRVREGKSNFAIAAELRISPLTVKNHVQKILRKLGVQNRAQAVARAIDCRLIESSPGP